MSAAARSHLQDVMLVLHHETAHALLVSEAGDKRKAVWLPKSQIEFEKKPKATVSVTAPEWLLTDKGLL